MVSPDLAALRQDIAVCDEQIVRLLAERMQLIEQVAAAKMRAGLPPFDRERESEHLEQLIDRAAFLPIPTELVRDVFSALFAASRRAQRRLLATNVGRFSIGIIGGTAGMGAFMAHAFERAGFRVEVTGLDCGPPSIEVASRHDVVIVAVPISVTAEVIQLIAPHVRKGACLADITSLKSKPLETMLAHAPDGVDVVGTHPMFGPQGDDFDRQKVVLCRGRGEAGFARMKRLYEALGAEVIEASAEEHDAHMALIQVLIHEKTMVLGSVLEKLKADISRSLQFASPIYRAELSMIGRMYAQSGELYAGILTSNPHAERVSNVFKEEATRFVSAVVSNDRTWISTRFGEVARFLSGFATWAKKESDAILQDIVRHG